MRTPPAGPSPFLLTRRAVILGMLSTLAACGATATATAPPAPTTVVHPHRPLFVIRHFSGPRRVGAALVIPLSVDLVQRSQYNAAGFSILPQAAPQECTRQVR